MINEKFIQDAFTNPARVSRVLREIGKDWSFKDCSTGKPDAITQEFSFAAEGEGGRIDILATFENRTKLMICEVKPGMVTDPQAEQLRWYVDNWISGKATIADESISEIRDVCGILLAEDFDSMTGQYLNHPNLHFVKFDQHSKDFPFAIAHPKEKTLDGDDEESTAPTKTFRQSWLWLPDDKKEHFPDEVKTAFDTWMNCFLDDNDPRRQWIVTSIKNSHISIHYKSEYITVLYPRKRSFVGGFGRGDINGDFSSKDDLALFKPKVLKILEQIDKEYDAVIPANNAW